MITDGLSTTLLLGEKCLNRAVLGRLQPADDAGWVDGWDWDTIRWAHLQPCPDFSDSTFVFGAADTWNIPKHTAFGSAHPASFNAAFCDGSIQIVDYAIDARTFQQLGSRDDGTR